MRLATLLLIATCPAALPTHAAEPIEASTPHVRILAGNTCGSGTICGQDPDGAWILTNAHVTGTALGRNVKIDLVTPGGTTRINAQTRHTGYSDRTMVDYSFCYAPGLHTAQPMQLLRTKPQQSPFETTGSPSCAWPQQTKPFGDVAAYGRGLITGLPNAIGGQSGSAIYDANKHAVALLTWSINGRCAGQTTAKLWQVATQADAGLADARPVDLTEIATDPDRPLTENAIQSTLANPIADLPVWHAPSDPNSPDPQPDQDLLSQFEKIIDLLSKILDALNKDR